MARDRQRAKQRRRRHADSSPASGTTARGRVQPGAVPSEEPLDAARDAGVEDVLDERGAPGTTPAPDPLKHSSPYVDEAKLAEAGAEFEPDSEPPAEQAPDALDYPASDAGGSSRGGGGAAEVATRPRRSRAMTFLRHSAEELKRVQWPNRRQTGQGTAVVLGFVVLAGGYLGLMDAIWKPIIEAIL